MELKKQRRHNINALNINHLLSLMLGLCKVCNEVKLEIHKRMNIDRNMYKTIS